MKQAATTTVPTGAPAWLEAVRQEARQRFEALGFPTVRLEEWRYTSVAALTKMKFTVADKPGILQEREIPFYDWHVPHIVFVDGIFCPEKSALQSLPAGVVVDSLANALRKDPEKLRPYLERRGIFQEHAFAAWNTAQAKDGAYVRVPRGVILQDAIHLLFVSTMRPAPFVSHLRNVIVLEEASQATLLESYAGQGKGVYCNNVVTQLHVHDSAVLDHYKFQQESDQAFHVGVQDMQQGSNSNVSSQSLSVGAALARNDIKALLADEGADLTLDGLYMASGRQHVDHHTWIDHLKPRCNSRELYFGILDGQSRGVFDGKIYVRQNAQKSNARQTNRNLLLSNEALAHSKPQLEIYADDVKCNHGATIGQLDENAIFYLRTRGIGPDAARALLTFAFANQILDKIKLKGLRAWLQGWVWNRLPGGEGMKAEP